MPQLFLRFHDDSFDGFDWTIFDIDTAVATKGWHSSSEAELARLMSQHPMPVVLVIPQQCVYMTEFVMPEKASRQILASIEYQIEDQLAQDTETQHYAIGQITDNKVPIAVVQQNVMQNCVLLQNKYGLRVQQIIPEFYLCPWAENDGQVNVLQSHDAVILRYGEDLGFKCKGEVIGDMLDMINRQVSIEQVNYYLTDDDTFEALNCDRYASSRMPVDRSPLDLEKNKIINLQQRQFRASSNWTKILQHWRAVAAVVGLLLVASVFNRVTALQSLESELAELRSNQYELIRDYAPQLSPSDNLKSEMIRLLQQNSSGQQSSDFISLLLDFSQASKTFPSIQISKIGYQQKRLSIDISSRQLNDVEALHAALNAKGMAAKLEKLNIKPELVSGQFVLEGDSNG